MTIKAYKQQQDVSFHFPAPKAQSSPIWLKALLNACCSRELHFIRNTLNIAICAKPTYKHCSSNKFAWREGLSSGKSFFFTSLDGMFCSRAESKMSMHSTLLVLYHFYVVQHESEEIYLIFCHESLLWLLPGLPKLLREWLDSFLSDLENYSTAPTNALED